MTRRPDLEDTVSFGEAAAIGRIERALFGGDAELVRVGRYEIVDRIGAGAFGRVYRAKDPQLARTIALKVLDVDRGIVHDDLLGEAKVMATIGHPNVAAIFDAGVLAEMTPTRVFIAMELVVGRNLREWLGAPRTVQAIVDVMRQVGQGIAAAHRAGIVHRDVKPENVLVGDDGRVRVVDFGLARATATRVDDDAPVTATHTGTIAGTPAYMAPELFEGAPASAASDQFAFCATMWEALYAVRPYGGSSVDELREAHARPLPDPPRKPRVPRPIVRALERGLSRDPAGRFGSMEAVIAELDRARSRRRLVIAALVGTAVLGAGAGVMIARGGNSDSGPACARPTAELAGVWDGARKAAIEKSFAATGDARAAATFTRVAELLDRATTTWLDAHQDACAATHVRHEQSPALLDRRMACLRDWRRRLAALSDRFARATPAIIDVATRAVAELPPISRCADTVELEAGPPRPTDPAVAKKLDELDDKLAEARVRLIAGEGGDALATAELVAREGSTLGYEPTQIAALLWKAEALTVLGRYDEARTVAKQCFDLALGIRDHRTAAIAASTIAFTGAFDSSRASESLDWVRTGESLRAKLELSDDIAAKLAHVEGNIYLTAADAVNAKPALERAIAAWRKLDAEHPNLGPTIAMLGIAEMNVGDMASAHDHLAEATRLAERDLGANHPELAAGLVNLGLVKGALGKYREAAEVMDRGLELQVRSLGENHPLVGYARLNRGQLAVALGDRARADIELAGARSILDASYGPTHAVSVTVALASGEHYARTGRGDLAREAANRALAATNAIDAAPRALAFGTLALAESVRGDRAAARAAANQARTSLNAASNATPSQRQIANDVIGEALLAIGDKADAITALRAADAQVGGPPDPLRRAHIRFALARATADRALARSIELPADADPALRDTIAKFAK